MIRLFLAAFLLHFSVFAYTPKVDWLKNLNSLDLTLITTPEQNHTPLYEAFAKAQNKIRIGIFGISSQEMADQIEKQIKRGIQVTIICDKYCKSNDKRAAIFTQLEKAGAKILIATKGFSITHWKMFIIDDTLAFISTMNFVTRTNQMRDIGIFTSNKSIITEIIRVFDQDVINAENQTNITPVISNPHLVWSPVNSEIKLVELINSADKSIEIWIENMGHDKIHEALQNAVKRGVVVRVLTSVCGMGMVPEAAYRNLKDLIEKGIIVKGTPYPASEGVPYIHAKTINIDHAVVFLGSENFSTNSITKARELGIVFKDSVNEQKLATLFEKDWQQAVAIPDSPPEKCSPLSINTED